MAIMFLDPTTSVKVNINLFRNVTNSSEVREKVLSGSLQCCVVNPKLILDPFQIVVAANKALICENRTTKSVYTEILFNLSISKNISRSLQQFGITENSEDLLIVTIVKDDDDANVDVVSQIKGEEVDLGLLKDIADLNRIKKTYKITAKEEESLNLLDSVVSRIATKDFISF